MQKLTLDTCQVLDDRLQEGIVIRTAKSASLTYINFDINLEHSSPLIYIGIIRRSLYPSSTTDPTKIYIKLSTEKGDRYAKYVSESRRLKSKEAEYKAVSKILDLSASGFAVHPICLLMVLTYLKSLADNKNLVDHTTKQQF